MPKLACRSCGRQVDAVSPIEAFAEERRCPRCGALMDRERRERDRRTAVRRVSLPGTGTPPGSGERRSGERRHGDRDRWRPREA